MNKTWLVSILTLSFLLLATLKTYELSGLSPYFKSERILKLSHFEKARNKVSGKDLELLKLWESMLTGRSAPLSRMLKERYKTLGLNHLFTPSGFHISAVLFPFMKLMKNQTHQLFLIIFLGIGLAFLPGMSALKRMVLIKGHQKVLGLHFGFIVALVLDIFFGSFQEGALSFTYSFLFIGIIYSGLSGFGLIIWFFFAQMILAYFQGNLLSPMLLIFSPLLNLGFSFAMPVLFLLAYPLWDWQLQLGLFILKNLQRLVDASAEISFSMPFLEIHIGVLLLVIFFLSKRRKWFLITLFVLSFDLNLDLEKNPNLPTKEFIPRGPSIKSIYSDKYVKVNLEDGNCRLKLVRGLWWKNCSPRRRSKGKSIMKLSYPSRGSRKSSLRG